MLADSLLPILFWAEAVNTACYVQNRALVTKPHNMTPYDLLLGRTPSIGFMKPFGCHVTMLNTLDPLGKFDGKTDEEFFVGYSVNSKAFRVFNRSGPKWLFDIDTITQSMNYQPVVAGNQPNPSADADAAFDVKENENEVHVSPRSSDKPKKNDEKAKREAKGKRIKREFSVARTPQQNRVAKRENRTLIEIARTMLADSLLPILFWAEAVNIACYVQNRALVTKPHNMTPYDLLLGRTPSIGFMRPFGCHVTMLNTLDPLGKFDGKADEEFLVGYSVNSKAFRVFNRSGPKWLFDIDTITQSMNYQPVVAGNQPNPSADADAAFDVKENENEVHVSPQFSVNITNSVNAASAPVTAVGPNPTNSTNSFNAAGPSDNVISLNFEISGKSSFVDPSQYPDDPYMPALEDIIQMMKKMLV
nr:ribonuclease H-like domain-containing protein [Tanacetum cinerariifolium]